MRLPSTFAVMGLFAACTFPEIHYHADGEGTGAGAAGGGAATGTSTGTGMVTTSTGMSGTTTTAMVSTGTAMNCDVDQDTHLRADAACGGMDCDDNDARAFPGQTAFYDTERTSGGYDFDCNNVEEGERAVECAVLPGSGQCPPEFLNTPGTEVGCGDPHPLVDCNGSTVCITGANTGQMVVQRCR